MYPIDLSGKHALVLGVANHRSLAWAITRALHKAGASLCLTYAGERLQKGVEELAATIPGAVVVPCDVTDDAQIDAVARDLEKRWGSVEMLVHGVAFCFRNGLQRALLAVDQQQVLHSRPPRRVRAARRRPFTLDDEPRSADPTSWRRKLG